MKKSEKDEWKMGNSIFESFGKTYLLLLTTKMKRSGDQYKTFGLFNVHLHRGISTSSVF